MRPHPNGGARILTPDTHVSHDSFCDREAAISGFVHKSSIIHSHIVNCSIAEASIESCELENCIVTSLYGKSPVLRGVKLKNVVVEGNVELVGPWELDGIARIPSGRWTRSPRYIRITGENGIDVGITESDDSHALIACYRKPLDQWIAVGERYGRATGWTDAQTKTAWDFFCMLRDNPL